MLQLKRRIKKVSRVGRRRDPRARARQADRVVVARRTLRWLSTCFAGGTFASSARIGQQGSLTYIWADKGSRPRAPRDQRYGWARLAEGSAGTLGPVEWPDEGYLFGAVCPARGVGAALVLPFVNTAAMNLHLAEISRQVTPGAHAVITLDAPAGTRPAANSRCRTGGKLTVPDNISLLPLPPYSPELNPVENIWQFLRQNHLSNRVFASYTAIVDACCEAWNALTATPHQIRSIATRTWAEAVTA